MRILRTRTKVIGCGLPTPLSDSGCNSNNISNMSRQQHPVLIAFVAILLAWLLAWSGYVISKHSKMTAAKVWQYQRSMNLSQMSPTDRLRAIKGLAERVNALSPEERQNWHL